jgi:hypothetical protein
MTTENENINEPVNENEETKVFSSFIRKTETASNQDHQKLFSAIPFIIFLVFLAIIQIANKHNAENKIRMIERTQKELRELRWQYMSTKSELMQKSRQSEVAKLLAPIGLYELRTPPQKISIEKSEHK